MPSFSISGDPSPSASRRIIVSHRLPLLSTPDPTSRWSHSFSLDPSSLAYQLAAGLPSPVIFVGTLPAAAAAGGGGGGGDSGSEELAGELLARFSCLPVFLPADLHARFYDGFCKHYLWPLLHYLLPLSPSHGGLPFDRELYSSFLSANKRFADCVVGLLGHGDGGDGDDDAFVWVHDYHLWALPTFLRRRSPRARVGFFLHSPFPSSEVFRTTPARSDLLRALLNADLVGFQSYDYARHFLSSCSRLLGIAHRLRRGHIGVEYYGRTVFVKILAVGIDIAQLRSVVSLPETARKVREIVESYKDRILMLGVDDVDLFKGIGLKFLAMERLLDERPELRGRAVLVQINNPARSEGRDVEEVRCEAAAIMERINARFGAPGYEPVVVIDQPLPVYEKVAYYVAAECCVVNAVRDGLNRIPYIYTVCRQEGPRAPRLSVIVVSEFVGCSPSLSGAVRVNPWNVEDVAEAMNAALTMPDAEKRLRHEKHYKYVSSHDVTYWARSFDQDLQRACRDHGSSWCWGIGLGMSFRPVALAPSFKMLSLEHIVPAYRNAGSRLVLLDYDGTMMPQVSINKAPSEEVLDVLNRLCSDPKNVVFVVSGRGKDELGKWFAPCEKLGISAEHGYFTRWTRYSPWESCELAVDFDWKKMAEPVMRHYMEATDGSYIEAKETALVWHHQEADPDFGLCQAKELLDHLENVLANEPVAVKRGRHIIEVNPQRVSKGVVVDNLIATMAGRGNVPDFILCMGDDESDEDMFESITSHRDNHLFPETTKVFACTVGKKPSMAKYYLHDTVDVISTLQGLANASLQPSSYMQHQVSFEGLL